MRGVIGSSGTGKSSVIAWLSRQLPLTHFALRIPVTGVTDPGNVGEIARLALSICLDEIMLDAVAVDLHSCSCDAVIDDILAADRGLSMCGRGCTVTTDWSGDGQADLCGDRLA